MKLSVHVQGVDEAIRKMSTIANDVVRKQDELCKRLADMGAVNVSILFSRAIYVGDKDFNVSVEDAPNGGYQIVVSGQSVAFVEFGAGITYGHGHPQESEFGVGAGTYPFGKGHWDDPNGWWIPKTGQHTYGNPPNMPMYNTAQDLKKEIARVTREVFSS